MSVVLVAKPRSPTPVKFWVYPSPKILVTSVLKDVEFIRVQRFTSTRSQKFWDFFPWPNCWPKVGRYFAKFSQISLAVFCQMWLQTSEIKVWEVGRIGQIRQHCLFNTAFVKLWQLWFGQNVATRLANLPYKPRHLHFILKAEMCLWPARTAAPSSSFPSLAWNSAPLRTSRAWSLS